MQRLLPPVLALLLLVLMGLFFTLLPGPVIFPEPWNWIGLVPIVGGAALTITGARLFGERRTNIRTFNDPTILVTDGPFRFSRNPMYLGFALFLTGVGILLGALVPLIVGLSFWLIADRWYIPFEEAAMQRTFGEQYDEYRQKVRRWF
ncbi:MAG TPA: isoprenylcysteine carboxylmethyltransferase family protein [Rhizobiaceae bacterium]|nr:isoprenylcysteine carboxylmethyltransferase family protein [Rhizobiaceae bacterium]